MGGGRRVGPCMAVRGRGGGPGAPGEGPGKLWAGQPRDAVVGSTSATGRGGGRRGRRGRGAPRVLCCGGDQGVAGGRPPRFRYALKTEVWARLACGARAAGDSSAQPLLGARGVGEGRRGLCKGQRHRRSGTPERASQQDWAAPGTRSRDIALHCPEDSPVLISRVFKCLYVVPAYLLV